MDRTLDEIGSILKEAGGLVKKGFGKTFEVKQKDQTQVVTEYDFLSEEFILKRITSIFPNASIIAEESGYTDNRSDTVVIVDPIDGTSNFASGLPWFGVMLAVVNNSTLIYSGIYLPMTDELYLAQKGKGVWKNSESFKTRKYRSLSDCLISLGIDPTADAEYSGRIFRKLLPRIRNYRATNSAVDYAYAAEGKLGALVSMNNKIWDIAPVYLLAQEAGCFVSDFEGKSFSFKIEKSFLKQNLTLLISSPGLEADILDIIKKAS